MRRTLLRTLVSAAAAASVAALAAPQRVLVTGANKGIGKAICRKLLESRSDVEVLLGARDGGRGAAAVAELGAEYGADRVRLVEIDTASDASVASAAATVAAAFPDEAAPLYGLVNNAGIGFGKGFDATLETNYKGPRRVTENFRPMVTSRICNIASASGPNFVERCGIPAQKALLSDPLSASLADVEALGDSYLGTTDYDNCAYGVSKALLNAYTALYARHEEHSGLIVTSCSPGYIKTDLTAGMGATNPPEKGAVAPCFCLFGDARPGYYYGSDAVRSPIAWYRGPGEPAYEGGTER